PFGAFAKSGGCDPVNMDAAPVLARGEKRLGLIVCALAGNDRHLVPALDQAQCHFCQILSGRHHVRVERLIKQKKLHWEGLGAVGCPNQGPGAAVYFSIRISFANSRVIAASASVESAMPHKAISTERWPELRLPASTGARRFA